MESGKDRMRSANETLSADPAPAIAHTDDVAALDDVWNGGVDDPAEVYRQLRSQCPVVQEDVLARWGIPSTAGDRSKRRFFTLLNYADVMTVLRDAKTYTSGVQNEGLGYIFDGMMILGMDGEEHKNARALLQEAFSPRAIEKWRSSFIEPLVLEEFIAPLLSRGRCDLLADFAASYPVRSVYRIIGLPDDPVAYGQFVSWGLRMLAAPSHDSAANGPDAALQASKDMLEHLCSVLRQRRDAGQIDGDDLISSLFNAVHEGRNLTDHEIAGFLRTVLPASAESTTRTFCNLMVHLLQQPGALETIRADRSLIPNAVEEAVRLEPVVSSVTREVQRDVEFWGVTIPKGSIISASTAAAGRDETVFSNPDEFDLHRPRKPAPGWGFGPHMCIGMQVARAEIEVAINLLLDHMPRLRLDPDFPPPKLRGAMLRSPAAVHVRWD
jgi:cytochrome P450